MGSKPASLLTKKQRTRIEDGFADLDEGKRRRDEKRIRERVRAGLDDFGLLADYPDRQIELAFEDASDEELRAALGDATLFVERVRELRGYERDELTRRARRRAERSADGDDLQSLELLDLPTQDEVRTEAATAVREELEPGPWDRRAETLLRVAASAAVTLVTVVAAEWLTATDLRATSVVVGVVLYLSLFVLVAALAGTFLVKAAQVFKHDVIPAVRSVLRDPAGVVRRAVDGLRRPGETLRESWRNL